MVERGKPVKKPADDSNASSARKIKRYGWIPDLPDHRDFTYAAPRRVVESLPPSIDLRGQCPDVYDQGDLGSCTGNAIAGALEFDMMKQGETPATPSRLFIYYNERVMEHTVGSDAGAAIRDGIKSVAKQGACLEGQPGDAPPAWPYVIGSFAAAPPRACYADAKNHKSISYQSITQNLADMKGCVAEGYPMIFGFAVFEAFESAAVKQTGNVPMPGSNDKTIGGHAVLAVGYDDEERVFIVRNSWGPDWGDHGYCYMPYAYLLDNNYADDFWTIRSVQ